jgi:hypothetical protein
VAVGSVEAKALETSLDEAGSVVGRGVGVLGRGAKGVDEDSDKELIREPVGLGYRMTAIFYRILEGQRM